jgi:hypothetical protein
MIMTAWHCKLLCLYMIPLSGNEALPYYSP